MKYVYQITDKHNDFNLAIPIYSFESESLRDKVLNFLGNEYYEKYDLELNDDDVECNEFEKWYTCAVRPHENEVCFYELNSIQHDKPINTYESYDGKLIYFSEVIPKEHYLKGSEHYKHFYFNRFNKVQNAINKLKNDGLSDDDINDWLLMADTFITW